MKKTLCAFALILFLASAAMAETRFISKTWTASATTAAVADIPLSTTEFNFLQGYGFYLYLMRTDPGTPAPTDNYDIVIHDATGNDILGGAGMDRDATNTETVMPLVGDFGELFPVDGALTIKISGNSVNSATGTIKLYFVK
jgi:hypothetical protein